MHALRHYFASACLYNGVDIRALSEYLGTTTQDSRCGPTCTWCPRPMTGCARRSMRRSPALTARPRSRGWHD